MARLTDASVRALPAPDAQACSEARREARRAGADRHGVRVVQLRRDAADLGRKEGRARREVKRSRMVMDGPWSHVTAFPCGAVRLVTEVAECPEDAENE